MPVKLLFHSNLTTENFNLNITLARWCTGTSVKQGYGYCMWWIAIVSYPMILWYALAHVWMACCSSAQYLLHLVSNLGTILLFPVQSTSDWCSWWLGLDTCQDTEGLFQQLVVLLVWAPVLFLHVEYRQRVLVQCIHTHSGIYPWMDLWDIHNEPLQTVL